MYKEIYNVQDTVYCVYSHHALYLDPTYPNPIDYLSKGGSDNGINCEHTYPQSKGAEFGNAKSDMHHLYPSRAAVNEARLNYPFAEIDDNKTRKWFYQTSELSSKPNTLIDEYSEGTTNFFEPREDHKGNVARAVFYFYTMYDIQADKLFFDTMRSTLCQWHILDPVDSMEWHRSQLIGKYQENKANPFVLDCSLASRTYCQGSMNCNLSSNNSILKNEIQIYYSSINKNIKITNKSNSEIVYVEILNILGQSIYIIEDFKYNELNLDVSFLSEGVHLINTRLKDNRVYTQRFISARL